VHPEPEISEFLSLQGYSGTARFGVRLDGLIDGEWRTLAFTQAWVEGSSVWENTVEFMRSLPLQTGLATDLGRAVGKLHRVLSSGGPHSAFGRKHWDLEAKNTWHARLRTQAERLNVAFTQTRPGRLDKAQWEAAKSVWFEAASHWEKQMEALGGLGITGEMSRIHGDLHLGQILEHPSPSGEDRFTFVDFEGEPARTTEARRAMDLPLRDVAGMSRSFAYAAAVAKAPQNVAEAWSEAFLEGWSAEAHVPSGDWRSLLKGLILEKAMYEVEYEILHRPDWFWIPMQALSKSLH
jgi:predicted trehalose synthase